MKISYQSPGGPMEVELTPGGLKVIYATGQAEVAYANLTALTLADQLYIQAGPQSTLAIPLSAFGSRDNLNAFARALLAGNPALVVSADQAASGQASQSQPAAPGQDPGADEDEDDGPTAEELRAFMEKHTRPGGKPGCLLTFLGLVSFLKIITIGRFLASKPPTKEETADFFTGLVPVSDARSLYQAAVAELAEGRLWAYTEVEGLTGERRCRVSLDFEEHKDQPLTREQVAAYDHLKLNFPRLKPAIIQALMDYNRQMRQDMKADGRGRTARAIGGLLMPPDIKAPEKFEQMLQPPRWALRREQKDGLAYVAVCYNPHWTVNTEGVVLHGERIVYVGGDPDFTPLTG